MGVTGTHGIEHLPGNNNYKVLAAGARAIGYTAIDTTDLRTLDLTDQDKERLQFAQRVFKTKPFFVEAPPAMHLPTIRSLARRYVRQHNIKLITIDYLQLIEPENKRESRQEQVANISRRLKHLAQVARYTSIQGLKRKKEELENR